MENSKTRLIQEIKNEKQEQESDDDDSGGTLEKTKILVEDAVQESQLAAEKVFSKEKRQQWKDAAISWFKKT